MRTQQFSVGITRVFKPVDKSSEEEFRMSSSLGNTKKAPGYKLLSVYADTNNFYEAFCAAYNETVEVISKSKDIHRMLNKKEKELYTNEMEVTVSIFYSELIHPKPFISISFSAVSENVYEALTIAFNKVLYEAQKHVDLPTFGRKEHYIAGDEFNIRYPEQETIPDFVFTNEEKLEGSNIIIPEKYLHIGAGVFKGREDIVNVRLPEGLMKIYRDAFKECKNLKTINIPESVISIGNKVFAECSSLKSIKIPNGVEAFYFDIFRGCTSLNKIILPKSGKLEIRGQSFAFCTSLKEITITAGIIKIKGEAFTGCSALKNIFVEEDSKYFADIDGVLFNKDCSILIRYPEGKTKNTYTIPDSVKEIDEDAFSGCKHLKTINIPRRVNKIANSVFSQSDYMYRNYNVDNPEYIQAFDGVTQINVDDHNKTYSDIDGVLFNKAKTALIKYPTGRPEKEYRVPDGVKKIAYNAFRHNPVIQSIIIPEGVIELENSVFDSCKRLKKISISKTVKKIGRNCFLKCTNLTDVTIHSKKIKIEENAFRHTPYEDELEKNQDIAGSS